MSSKYEQLASILKSKLKHMISQGITKLETEAELCEKYHMSRQTVRHALKLLESEGYITRRQGSGSHINKHAFKENSNRIAVITTFLDDYIFPSILHDAQTVFSSEGYSTLIYTTENKVGVERDILNTLLEQNICAVLVEGSKTALPTPNADLYDRLKLKGIPVLFLHGIYSNLKDYPCLFDDNFKGGYQLAEYLISNGHSSVSGIFKSDDLQGSQRYHGVISAMRDHCLNINDDCFSWYDTEERRLLVNNSNYKFIDDFIQNRLDGSTSVVCYNDEIAHFLIRRLLSSGKRVPDDVAVVSFDNSFYSHLGPVSITSLGHKGKPTGKAAAELLLDILTGGEQRSVLLEWELNKRGSA